MILKPLSRLLARLRGERTTPRPVAWHNWHHTVWEHGGATVTMTRDWISLRSGKPGDTTLRLGRARFGELRRLLATAAEANRRHEQTICHGQLDGHSIRIITRRNEVAALHLIDLQVDGRHLMFLPARVAKDVAGLLTVALAAKLQPIEEISGIAILYAHGKPAGLDCGQMLLLDPERCLQISALFAAAAGSLEEAANASGPEVVVSRVSNTPLMMLSITGSAPSTTTLLPGELTRLALTLACYGGAGTTEGT